MSAKSGQAESKPLTVASTLLGLGSARPGKPGGRALPLDKSLILAGHNLLAVLDPSVNYLPTWRVDPYPQTGPQSDVRWPSHNIGRWWIAMLDLESTLGFHVPRVIERAMLTNLVGLFDPATGLPCHVTGYVPFGLFQGGHTAGRVPDAHSFREVLLALVALARCKLGERGVATGLADAMVAGLHRLYVSDLGLDATTRQDMAEWLGVADPGGDGEPGPETVYTHGRLIEALLDYYDLTGSTVAFDLAERLVRFHLRTSTREDGTLPVASRLYVHTHSYLGLLRGLLAYGQSISDTSIVDRVRTCLDGVLAGPLKPTGFIAHNLGWDDPGLGETSSPGDVAQLAIRLGRLGHHEYWDVADRMVRARILPSQLIGDEASAESPASRHDIRSRMIGAFGGMHRHPYGVPVPTTDVTAADVHSLCEVYRSVVEPRAGGWRVNLHHDIQMHGMALSVVDGPIRRIAVRATGPGVVSFRVPAWAPMASVAIRGVGNPASVLVDGRYVVFPVTGGGDAVEVAYPMPTSRTIEQIGGIPYAVQWHGDEVDGVAPNAPELPFYRDLPPR